jgi:hypothetical protein
MKMKQLLAGCTFAVLSLIFPPRLVQAQTGVVATRPASPFSYDISQELTLSGTVSSVLAKPAPDAKPAPEMIVGAHILLTTVTGPVDISLGTLALQGKGALNVAAGQQIQVIGVMKVFEGKQVLLARTVKVEDDVYAIRNEHGVPISPLARERASQKITPSGETR